MRSKILNYGMTALLLTVGLAAPLQGSHHGDRAKTGPRAVQIVPELHQMAYFKGLQEGGNSETERAGFEPTVQV